MGTPVVRAALYLAPMLLLRPGELRHGQWAEFDLGAAEWVIPSSRMKRELDGKLHGPPHIVPLPRQAVMCLHDLQALTGAGLWVFRGERHHHRPMSENTVNAALRAMGFPADEVTGHGFRATARTLLAERLNVPEAVIEAQLAHSVKDSLGRAYTDYIERAASGERQDTMNAAVEYLIFPEQFRTEVCKGFDAAAVAKVLRSRECLRHEKNKLTNKQRLPGTGKRPVSCYHLKAAIFEVKL
jgi:integrase